MEQIITSIENGQWKQAAEQLKNSKYQIDDIVEFIIKDQLIDNEDLYRFIRVLLQSGYLIENKDKI